MCSLKVFGLCRGSKDHKDVVEYLKCAVEIMAEPMCLDPQRSRPLTERAMVLWTSFCERGLKGGLSSRRYLQSIAVLPMHAQPGHGRWPEPILEPTK